METKIRDAAGDSVKTQAAIDASIKKMRLEQSTGKSTYPGDRFTLSKDPGLRPLWNAFQGEGSSDPQAFAAKLFALEGPYKLSKADTRPTHRISSGTSTFLFWLTWTEP